jgi:hypothetical protein
VALPTGRAEGFSALVALYDSLGDNEGLRRALEGQLALTRQPAARISLLRHLGDHCAHRLGDDARAEACWREVLAVVPDDPHVRDELIALYRRRGDFEALDRTFGAHAWRPLDDQALLSLWRAAATNVQENLNDSSRALRSWLRVLDLRPEDNEAREAQVVHERGLGRKRGLIAALEEAIAAAPVEERAPRALEVASLWEQEGDKLAAMAAYERVLRFDPAEPRALERLRTLASAGAAQGALDVAAAKPGADALALAGDAERLVPSSDGVGRFFALRRRLSLGDGSVVETLAEAAEKAELHGELEAVYLDLAAQHGAPWHDRLAFLYEGKLNDPVRAFLVLSSARQAAVESLDDISGLTRLAQATGRHEDHLALLDVAARAGAPIEVRRAALRRRLEICEKELKNEERAFREAVRLLRLDSHDDKALSEARRLAAQKGLWRPLDALYAELSDRASSVMERIELARSRHAVRANELKDASAALDQLLVIYRLDPTGPIEGEILAAAERDKAWEKVLPLVEARIRSAARPDPDELSRLAALHADKRGAEGQSRAFELYAEAFVHRPSSTELEAKLEALSGPQLEMWALALRSAAARSDNPLRTLELYRKVAAVYTDRLQRPDLALDVHRRILQLDPRSLPSLEVVVAHQREAKLWRELRDSLTATIEAAGEAGAGQKVARLLEVARLSRVELADAETALATYAAVLDLDAQNSEALEGIRSLTEGVVDAQLEVRRLRIELGRTQGPRRAEILIKCAEIQDSELDDPDAAIVTLRQLVEESGAAGPAFAPLSALYERKNAWGDLVDLIEARALALPDAAAQLTELERASALCEAHPDTGTPVIGHERRERVLRRILERRPADVATRRRLLALYRTSQRHAELVALLSEGLSTMDPGERTMAEDELVRIYDRALDRTTDAAKLLESRVKQDNDNVEALRGLATLALRADDFARYVKLRTDEAKALPPRLGALVLCHLAEATDEKTPADQNKVLDFYRQARALDANNQPAMEALKAIGRRTKAWRAGAALLNDSDERTTPWSERARRLAERGDACLDGDVEVAISWFEKAVAVDGNNFAAWDGIARAAERRNDASTALDARRGALRAFERATTPEASQLGEHARRLEALAAALRAITAVVPHEGDEADARLIEADRLSERAYELAPTLAPAALAVADRRLADGVTNDAYAIYDRVLQAGAELTTKERLHGLYSRGVLASRLGRLDQAIADLREGLRIDSLHSGLLNALAQVLAQKERITAAIQHYTQALLLASDEKLRGQLYARLGRLWEDKLQQNEEAGVCYDLAIASGMEDADLSLRALGHYRRSGQTDRALEVIEHLLPATTKPQDLAQLWAERGHILALSDQEKAMEAFDMALSYDPSCQTAVSGLAELLEKRGDWKQLVELLEVRAEAGTPSDRAEAMRGLARICQGHLNDRARAEKFLQSAIELDAHRGDFEALIALYGDNPADDDKKKEALAGLLELGGPYMPRLIELGRSLYADGRRRWAWCVLSPLMNSTMPDPQLKSMVLELRKEFEKAENVNALSPETHKLVRHRDLPDVIADILVTLDERVQLGPTTNEQIGASQPAKLDARTATGKTFATIAEKLGMAGASLSRVQELSAPFRVLDGDSAQVVARSDLFQLLSPAETNALFASMIEATRPGARLVTSLGTDGYRLIPALLIATGAMAAAEVEEAAPLAEQIRGAGFDQAMLDGWRDVLAVIYGAVDGATARHIGEKVVAAVGETARRVGLVAAADLRFAAKLVTRLDEALPKLPSAGKLEDLDDFFGGAAPARALLGFSVSPRFGRALE